MSPPGAGTFLVYDDGYRARSYTYAETATAARGFAARLQSAGLGKGDKVVFWSENRPEWIIALWGCLLNGSIAVPIDYRASHEFLAHVARIVDAKLLLLGDDVEIARQGTREQTSRRALDDAWKFSDIDFRALDAAAFTPVAVTRDDTVEIIFTSGATAEPKGVVLTHRNVLANIIPVEKRGAEIQEHTAGRSFPSVSSTCCRSATCSARPWPHSCRRCCTARWCSCAATTRTKSCGR